MKTVGEIAKSRGGTYKCRVCGEGGTQRGMVCHFIRRHAPLEQVPFSCSLCGYRACRLGHLKKHFSIFADHKKAAEGICVSDDKCIQKAGVPYRVRNFNSLGEIRLCVLDADAHADAQSDAQSDADEIFHVHDKNDNVLLSVCQVTIFS